MSNGRDDRTEIAFTVADRLDIQSTKADVASMMVWFKKVCLLVISTCVTVIINQLFM